MKAQKGFILLQTSVILLLIFSLLALTNGYSKKLTHSTLRFTRKMHANLQISSMEKIIKYVLSQTNFGYFTELNRTKNRSQYTGTVSLFNETVSYDISTASTCINLRALLSDDPTLRARAQQLLSNLTEDLFKDPEKGIHFSMLLINQIEKPLSLKKLYSLLENESLGDISKLKPYLCYLPVEHQCVDINSMTEDRLPVLYAFLAPHISKERLSANYEKIANIGYIKNIPCFLTHFILQKDQPDHLKKEFTTFSKFFKLKIQFSNEFISTSCDILIYRDSPTEGFSSVYKVCQ